MQMGLIGLGRMGGNMKARLEAGGHQIVGFDNDPSLADVKSLADLVEALEAPRAVWVMVPHGGPTRDTVHALAQLLSADDIENAAHLAGSGIGYVDVGVSGGVWGRTNGYALMVGGADSDVARLQPIFD